VTHNSTMAAEADAFFTDMHAGNIDPSQPGTTPE
jgi:hypothetical protein